MTVKTNIISFEIPIDLLASLKIGVQTLSQQIRLIAAINYFQEKRLSLGKAAQLAGLNRLVFMDILAERGIVVFDFDETELAVELEGVKLLDDHQ
jgi:predicted HTH domain antitoxin